MGSSGEGEDFQDIWTETPGERGCDQSDPGAAQSQPDSGRLRNATGCAGGWGGKMLAGGEDA